MLGAALLHASWNAMLKGGRDTTLDMAIVVAGGALVVVPLLPFMPLPSPASWPYLAASVVIHIGYYIALVGTYRAGDLSHGYPLMRGGGHKLLACFVVAKGKDASRFCGTANAIHKDWHGYRVRIALRTPRHGGSPDVWLQIDPTP